MDLTIAEKIREGLSELTATERRAAHALLAHYPMIGLQTVAEFAARAGVSTPTILRFIAKLGFASYPDFQRRLHEELEAQLQTPLTKSAAAKRDNPRAAFFDAVTENIRETFDHLPPAEFDAVAKILADEKRRIHLVGGRFTDALARYLGAHLRILRGGVSHFGEQEANWADRLIDLGKKDVLVLFDIRRYQPSLDRLARDASARGVCVILFTDQWLSPVSRVASHILAARVSVPSAWDSNTAIMSLCEALLATITEQNKDRSTRRMRDLEVLRTRTEPEK